MEAFDQVIYLDEIDSTSPHTQVGLLRVLEDKHVRPIGSVSTKEVNVRVIASTQKNLFKQTEEGRFRDDLYYRISALIIALPPLRKRMEDTDILIDHLVYRLYGLTVDEERLVKDITYY